MTDNPDYTDMESLFARANAQGEKMVDMRFDTPASIVAVLDASVHSKEYANRAELINGLIRQWAEKKLHEASVLYRVARGNPTLSEAMGLTDYSGS